MARTDSETLAQQARFIFQGTVRQRGAATMADVPVSARTLIVRVDRILQAPRTFDAYLGREITVQLKNSRAKAATGQTFTFYTNGWLFGDSLAVQSVGQLPAPAAERTGASALALVTEPATSAQDTLANRDLQDRLNNADMVVLGRVTAVRLPQTTTDARANRLAAAKAEETGDKEKTPISEHDPEWREAVVEVQAVEKGAVDNDNVVIRFPSSDDVQWYRAPKFAVGQEGVFLLHDTQGEPVVDKEVSLRAAVPREGAAIYDALHPADYQPPQQLPVVRALLAKSK
jgi:hypothetical protein